PFDLRAGIPVHDIAFLVLEVPRDHNEDVPFPDPDFLLDFSLDPAHPCHTVETADPDMVCTHHKFGTPEHFPIAFLGQFDPDDLIARWYSRFLLCQYNLSSSNGFYGFCALNCWCKGKYIYSFADSRNPGALYTTGFPSQCKDDTEEHYSADTDNEEARGPVDQDKASGTDPGPDRADNPAHNDPPRHGTGQKPSYEFHSGKQRCPADHKAKAGQGDHKEDDGKRVCYRDCDHREVVFRIALVRAPVPLSSGPGEEDLDPDDDKDEPG